ncbi:MAG: phospholipid carrier-dependent glycosyltransferase [Ktedonobacteraceae bacterium]|nr:phospholipid carrier-dependent glycosyltransferase [Ktedonobacteraceae bacterium]
MKLVIRWRPLVLWGLMLLGLALRLYGLNWDQGNSFHPDERQILFQVTKLAWPTSFALFCDPVNSPLNPHFFAYGSLPLYLLALVGHILAHFSPSLGSFTNMTLIGRVLSALFDSGTIVLTGYLALRLTRDTTPGRPRAWNVALLAAALVTFTPFQLQLAHFYAVDTMLLFFVEFTVLACVILVETEHLLLWSILAGVGYGLAVGTKFSAAPLALPVVVAILLRWYQRRDLSSAITTLFSTALATILAFLIVDPYALLDRSNFIQQVADQGSLARGTLDLPYVRQFAGTLPVVYQAQNIVLWGLGLLLGIAAFAGFCWLLWRIWKRDAALWLVVLSWVLVYGAIMCSFYVKFMRYMLPVYPFLTLMAASFLLALVRHEWRFDQSGNTTVQRLMTILRYSVVILPLAGTIFQGLALLNVYSQPNTRIQASNWIYNNLKPGSVLTYEQWDDPLPIPTNGHDPSIYVEANTNPNGVPTTGLDLYGDDTLQKAQTLASLLPTLNAITMPTERLSKSIPRLPARYPLTLRYYQLLFNGQLGFHLAAQFENHPNLFGITLNDSGADESYWVFDHPTARIFVRDTPYPYTPDQLLHKLTDGVQLPAPGATLSGAQRSLILTPGQIANDQQSPAFGVQFSPESLANKVPVLFWWLALLLVGLLAYPLLFYPFRALPERGYLFSKLCGVLLLAYLSWLFASLHLLAFSNVSLWCGIGLLLIGSGASFLWQRQAISTFFRQHWRKLLAAEGLFTLAFLLFVVIRAFNPDLWNIYRGGEKPMELAFLNAVLRSSYMPPYDPWFAGGSINYYYYGYVVVASLIKLTGIVPTTAFNLAIPTLFAWTFCGAVVVVYGFSRRIPIALLGGYFAVLIGNFNGLAQFRLQLQSLLARLPIPAFDYWQSSRIIPFTINEFPFWSFLFADMHPHVMDMPVAVFMLGIIATFLLSERSQEVKPTLLKQLPLYLFAAFVFGTIACINPWDMPVYALLLIAALGILTFLEKWHGPKIELLVALVVRLLVVLGVCALGYLFYLPFYASYQQLFVNGVGRVVQGTGQGDYLTVSGFWIFLVLSFFLVELYRRGIGRRLARRLNRDVADPLMIGIYTLCTVGLLVFCTLVNIKVLLGALLLLGIFLFILLLRSRLSTSSDTSSINGNEPPDTHAETTLQPVLDVQHGAQIYTYLLLIMGLCIGLGIELVYIRDFLDGGDYERMNTVFKFSIQAWLCFALAGALVVQYLWRTLAGFMRQLWTVILVVFVLSCSIFLVEGTVARINDRQLWQAIGTPEVKAGSIADTNYTPTLDGLAFARIWYPGDAQAIDWLNAHVAGSPVILEAASPDSYQWFSRVSVFTGLPDVLGWSDHESEQRYATQLGNRLGDIGTIYSTSDTTQALALLHSYSVHYVYVGALERKTYGQLSLTKFDQMPDLHRVYSQNNVIIYEVD